ncbi:MAG: HD-GYP domain-containing protein [Gammaproteobacteria bacterium]|nr:HD-GYP domain-containing protein [Pseudomaricurvus alcaniphilus]MBR9910952.1 HD-GYP domain-containing protein [Gammaproteobacteria bacterium]NHN37662.1 HD-GYP domain-containing protein [Pseudomaricurvus alcaniphilus]
MKSVRGRRKIHVSELQVGMYVAELDRDWLGTPFLLQGFTVQSRADVETVQKYCEHVWIEATDVVFTSQPVREGIKPARQSQPRYVNKVSTATEHRQAFGIHHQARSITKSLLDEVRLGAAVNTEQARETVSGCVQSILRNADAMLWMTRIRNEDEYTAEHCLNVCVLAIAFGRHLGMDEGDLHKIGLCGLLHDVGKMKIAPEVLNKREKLTDKEFKMIKAHTVHGRNLLMASSNKDSYLGMVDVAYSHHERLDGTGYPRKLKASGISTFARIIAIVDAYDAMTTKRCYENARPSTEALKEIYRCRGTHFDEELAERFTEMVGLYPPGSIVELRNGQVGIVFDTNQKYRHLPKVLVVRDENKQPCPERVVALADTEKGTLDKTHLIQRVITDGTHGVTLQEYREKGLQISFN